MNKQLILTVGVWDLFHCGHLSFLKSIKKKYPNSKLIVGVLSDKAVRLKKGKSRPIINEKERLEIVKNIKCVDKAFICKFFKDKQKSMIFEKNRIKPDLIIWGEKKILKQSTTQIIGKISSKYKVV